MSTKHTPIPLDGMLLRDADVVEQKLRQFKDASKDKTYYLFDFDRTLTTSSHLLEDITLWDLLDDLLPDGSRELYDKMSKDYQRREFAGELSEEDAMAWWALSFELYIEHNVNFNEIHQALGKLRVRAGAKELFDWCEANGVPTVILSAGIGNIIEILTETHGMHPTTILSTELKLAEDGRITGWDPESVVHILNKHEMGHPKLSVLRSERPYTVLMGDSLEDARMVKGDDHVLRIRVGDRREGHEADWQDYLAKSFAKGFDIVVEKESLEPVVRLAKWLSD